MRTHTVHQLIATASPGDAVTGQALAWRRALARHGIDGEVFAEHVMPELRGHVRSLQSFSPHPQATTMLHYSIWSEVVNRALALPPERLAVCYHNITPAHYLEVVNPVVAALCSRGRRGLVRLAGRVRVAIADSPFNAEELEASGIDEVCVVPLLFDLGEHRPISAISPPHLITVGRIVPNKRLEDVIRAFALLQRHLLPGARLTIVGGSAGFEPYAQALQEFVERLGITSTVTFAGHVSDARLKEIYAEAGAYVCMSEHEGFCAPLIEALSQGVPVVARAAAAVPSTLGRAGLLVPTNDPAVGAEALHAVLTDRALRATLGERAERRLAELAPSRVEGLMLEALGPMLA